MFKVKAMRSSHRGEPSITFAQTDLEVLLALFTFALVGKFSKGRPIMDVIQKFFLSLDLKETVSVGLLDSRHVLIRLGNEMDFHRLWSRGNWYSHGVLMSVLKWSPAFHVDREPSVVLVWFQLPKLMIHYFAKECLFQIVSCIGKPLFMDSATASGVRLSVARVCVEIDLLQTLPVRIWIANRQHGGFWQQLIS